MTTAIVKFRPLCGAKSEGPLCYLLSIDDFTLLLDCGWSDTFDPKELEPIRPWIPEIDAVLISHPDMAHLGALPYLVGKLGLKAPVYATIPVYKMGLMFMYDAFEAKKKEEDFDVWDLDDVDTAFDSFSQLKYSQHFKIATDQTAGAAIFITPYAAGHMIGGTVWKIVKETEEIIYAVDYNHKKERHLNPTVLETLNRPTLLITDAFNAMVSQTSRSARDMELVETIMKTLRGDGNVLLPTDTAGRVLELLLTLDQHWSYYRLASSYALVLLHNESYNTIEFAKSQLEWMSTAVQKSFDNDRENPFSFKCVRLCHNLSEVEQLTMPAVVLASTGSLEYGPAMDLLLRWGENSRNSVIFTTRPQPGSRGEAVLKGGTGASHTFTIKRRVALEGEELVAFRQKEKERRLAEAEDARRKQEEELERQALAQSEEMDESDVPVPPPIHNPFTRSYDWVAGWDPSPHPHPLFPYTERRYRWDEFGRLVDPEHLSTLANSSNYGSSNGDMMAIDDTHASDGHTAPSASSTNTTAITPIVQTPTKTITLDVSLTVGCPVKYIDFEGLSDGRSIKTILDHVSPRKIILVHGPPPAVDHLAEYCLTQLKNTCNAVLCPDDGECVDATSDTNIYKVSLSESVTHSIDWKTVDGYQLAYIDTALTNPRVGQGAQTGDMLLQPLPSNSVPPHEAIFVGELRLAHLKDILSRAGFQTEFAAGVLVVNGVVMLKKEEAKGAAGSRINVSGALCEDYYQIRKLLYEQFCIF